MEKKDSLTKFLAIIGTALACIPILAPVIFTMLLAIREGIFRFDYLMPAELFSAALIGGGLLIWAALRARSHQKMIGWGLLIAAFLLVGGQAFAIITGLASGATEAAGWRLASVLALLVLYTLALIVVDIGGLLLLRDLFKSPRSTS